MRTLWGHTPEQGRGAILLTDVPIRNAKPRPMPYKLGDSLGLFLLVWKLWRLKYRVDGKEKKLPIEIYNGVGLAEARHTAFV